MRALGFFGKLPAVGDFVSRGLDRTQIKVVDAWLQQGLTELPLRDAGWLNHYLVAPVWCFAIPAGQWSDTGHYGAIMASADRVGRYFPLLVLGSSSELLADHVALHAHMQALAKAMPEVLSERLSPEAFSERLQHLNDAVSESDEGLPMALSRFNLHGDSSVWWAGANAQQPGRELSHTGSPDARLLCQIFCAAL